AILPGKRCSVSEAPELGRARLAFAMRVATGVKLDDGRLQTHRRLDLARIGLDEEADADARVRKARDDGCEMIVLPCGIEPALGRTLLALFRDNAGSVRRVAQR